MSDVDDDECNCTCGIKQIADDLINKVNAGSALVWAIYHAKAHWVQDGPASVLKAIARAQGAYGINTYPSKEEPWEHEAPGPSPRT